MTPHALIAPARLAGAPLLRAQSDERLVDLVRAGNVAAFEAIVGRYRRPLLRYVSGFMSEARAEDAVQTAFVSAFGSLRASHGEMNLRPWLYRIAHNTALNALRDRSLAHEELSDQLDGVERPDQAYEKSERLRDVVAAVSALPDRQRDAIVLRELEGRSYEEIAAELGVSGGSVRQLLNRGRNSLRAGMTALTPFGLLTRMPWGGPAGGEAMAARVAELCGAGAGAVVTKVCTTAIVTSAMVGGVASGPAGGLDEGRARADDRPRQERRAKLPGAAPGGPAARARVGGTAAGERGRDDGDRRRGRGRSRGDENHRFEDRDGDGRSEREDEGTERGRTDSDDGGSRTRRRSGSGSGESESDDHFGAEPIELEYEDRESDSDSSGSGSGKRAEPPEDDD